MDEPSDDGPFPAVLDRIADEFSDHDALVTDDRTLTYAELQSRGQAGRGGDDRPGRERRRPGRDLVAEHLALGGRLPGHPLRGRRRRPAEHPLHRQRGHRHPGPHRGAAADRHGRVPRRRPDRRTRPRRAARAAPHRPGARSTTARRHLGRVRRPRDRSRAAVDARAAAVTPDDVSDILFTSGTTGRSKGVLCAHRQSLDAPAAWAACGELTSADRYLCINPFFHNFGYKAGHPGLPADRRDADPAADVRSREGHARRAGPPDHRAARAADDLPDAARPSRSAATTT